MLEIPEHSKPDNRVCEAIGCYKVATEEVKVPVGNFGTIILNLCQECSSSKFGHRTSET